MPLLFLNVVVVLAVNQAQHGPAGGQGQIPQEVQLALLEDTLHADSPAEHVQLLQIHISVAKENVSSSASGKADAARSREEQPRAARPREVRPRQSERPWQGAKRRTAKVGGLLTVGAVLVSIAAFSVQHSYSSRDALKGTNAPESTSTSKPRLAALDIAKFILMGFVVFTHLHPVWCGPLNGFDPRAGRLNPVISNWYIPFMMPAFSLLAGMFGAGVSVSSLSKVFCYTIGGNVFCMLLSVAFYSGDEQLFQNPSAWFLWSLLSWRLLISPSFYLARKACIPSQFLLVLLHCIGFFLFYTTYPGRPRPDANEISKHAAFVYAQNLAFTRFFAVGLLQSPKEWYESLASVRICCLGVLYLIVWFTLDVLYPEWFLKWTSFRPPDSGITFREFLAYTLDFAMLLCLVLAVLNVIVVVSVKLSKRLPRLLNAMEGWGTRTLYCYVLHRMLLSAVEILGIREVTEVLPENVRIITCALACVGTTVLFCSDGVRYIFQWAIEPYWVIDRPSKFRASAFLPGSVSGGRQ